MLTGSLRLALPILLAAAAYAAALMAGDLGERSDWSDLGAQCGLVILFGAAALAIFPTRLSAASVLIEGLAIGGLTALCAAKGSAVDRLEVGWVVLFALAAPWSAGLVLRTMERPGLARAVQLGLISAACGSFWLVPKSWSPVPDALLIFNPLVRLHQLLPPEDFAFAYPVYQRIAGRSFSPPAPQDGVALLATVCAASLALAGLIAWLRARQRSSESEPVAPTP